MSNDPVIRQLQVDLDEYKKDYKITKAALASRDRDAAQARVHVEKLKEEVLSTQHIVNKQRTEIQVLANEKRVLSDKNEDLTSNLTSMERDLRQTNAEMATVNREKRELEKLHDAACNELDHVRITYRAEQEEWRQQLSVFESQQKDFAKQTAAMKSPTQDKMRKLVEENSRLKEMLEQVHIEKENLETQLQHTTQQVHTTRAKLADLLRVTEETESVNGEYRSKICSLQQQSDEYLKRIKELEHELVDTKSSTLNCSPDSLFDTPATLRGGESEGSKKHCYPVIDKVPLEEVELLLCAEKQKREKLEGKLHTLAAEKENKALHYESEIRRMYELVQERTNSLCNCKEQLAKHLNTIDDLTQKLNAQAVHIKSQERTQADRELKLYKQINSLQSEVQKGDNEHDTYKQTTQHQQCSKRRGTSRNNTCTRQGWDENSCGSNNEETGACVQQWQLEEAQHQVHQMGLQVKELKENREEEKQKALMHTKLLQAEILELTAELERVNTLYISSVRHCDDIKAELTEAKQIRSWQMGMIQQVMDQIDGLNQRSQQFAEQRIQNCDIVTAEMEKMNSELSNLRCQLTMRDSEVWSLRTELQYQKSTATTAKTAPSSQSPEERSLTSFTPPPLYTAPVPLGSSSSQNSSVSSKDL